MTNPVAASAKNIVLCSDGTGNYYSGVPSNVRRLYTWIERWGPRQISCYHPGVSTHPRPEGRTAFGRRVRHYRELCFGAGVMQNTMHLYTFLMQHYEPGDRIFLFGFSRGAFTVRALAGMLRVCGLLRRDDAHLVSVAAGLYRTSEARIKRERRRRGLPKKFASTETTDHAALDTEAREFRTLLSRECPVAFMGVWDTVKAYGWLNPQSFPALRHNPIVEIVRHAVALHERRALFKVTGWGDRRADVEEVWFAGDHSDVGGGHDTGNSPLADVTLRWMLGEATKARLRLDRSQSGEIVKLDDSRALAPATPPHDLWWRGGFWALDQCPRMELNNSVYPPNRRPRVFWPDGRRKPADHADRGRLRVHHTLIERWRRDGHASRDRFVKGLELDEESDLPIVWHDEIGGRSA